MPDTILLIGATGETGRRALTQLLAAGHRVRATHRRSHGFPREVEALRADVRDSAAMQRACAGARAVVSCLGNRRYFGKGGMHDTDVLGTRALAHAAASAGVEHFVLLSAFGLDRRSLLLSAFSAALNRYFHHKQLVEDAVRDSGVPFTFVRAHELRNRAPRGQPVLNQTEPIGLLRTVSRDTVARVLAACVLEPRAVNAVFELIEGGDEPLSVQLDRLERDGRMHLDTPRTPLR